MWLLQLSQRWGHRADQWMQGEENVGSLPAPGDMMWPVASAGAPDGAAAGLAGQGGYGGHQEGCTTHR